MSRELAADDKLRAKHAKPEEKLFDKAHHPSAGAEATGLLGLQQKVGNSAVQRMLAQRSAEGGFEVDEVTTNRINQARGGGQALDGQVAQQMGETLGYDFSGVRVHTSTEANDLSQNLQAKAFTTGQDIFFKEGTYNPGSSSGRELLAHELTHVVQQGTGQVPSSGGGLTVNPPDDVYEQQADAVAKQTVTVGTPEGVQRQEIAQEDELMMKRADLAQREAMPEEEELQTKRNDLAQREAMPEEEELQTKRADTVQRCNDSDEGSA
ncbi:MAG: DUF4157 domain-containing protein [Anaerolineae bacterium]|nr:DUF4157 domain-containing protein [Anaerolineae bacterium]